jgi:hypothetical protein
MKARLKVLPDKLRGGAWPSPVRAVRCPVKSGNDRDPRLLLPAALQKEAGHTRGTAADKAEEGVGHGRSVCPESPGPHASCNGRDNGLQPRKGKVILKPCLSWDRGLQPALVKHGIPSNRASSSRGEYVPAPCTHRPSLHPSEVWMRRGQPGCVEPGFRKEGEVVTRWP